MRSSRSLHLATEVGLTAVTVAAVLGMARLFDAGDWRGPLVVNAVAAHLVAALCRRRNLGLPMTAAAMALGAVLVTSWASYWSTTTAGIPTSATWSAMSDDLSSAWTLYQDVVAPAPVVTGFVLASAVALWCVAYVADWAAFRLWVPFEATLPASTLFLFTALLGDDAGRSWAVALYAAAVLGFLLLHRIARQDGSSHWVADGRIAGHRSLLTAGAALGVVAVVVGTVLGPSLPGADSAGVLDPRSLREGEPARETISPLVDIRSRLVDLSPTEMFTVQSSEPSYWRITGLERFDGQRWTSSRKYSDAGGRLPQAVEVDVDTTTFEQSFTISGLAAIWLPSAYEPRALDVEGVDVLYDDESATLIVGRESETSDGLAYRVTSSSPRITAADLAGTGGAVPAAILDEHSELPDDFSPEVRDLARDLTADAASPYEQALALQNHLRTFTYDLDVASGHRSSDIEEFLFVNQRGYCEQFAGSFAAMARSIGLPARVAVGFTQGEADPDDPNLYRVRGEHAHAWPEVFLAGAGWVAFEPTPGRGMPFAEDYTGVQPAQATPGDPSGSEDVTPTTNADAGPTATTAPAGERPDGSRLDTEPGPQLLPEETGSDSGFVRYVARPVGRGALILAVLGALYAALFPLALLLRRHRRRHRATTPAQRIALAWTEAAESGARVGFREASADTFDERTRRLAAHVPVSPAAAAAEVLARHLEVAAYSAEGADEADAVAAETASAVLQDATRDAATWPARAAAWLDPRPYVTRWRRLRTGRQRHITTTVRADLEAERELVGTQDR